MIDLFLSILNMSLKASYVILVVMLIRLSLKKAPKFVSYALWGAVAFRLIIPFSFESILSIMPKNPNTNLISPDIVYQRTTQINNGIDIVDTIVDSSVTVANNIGGSVPAADVVGGSVSAADIVADSLPAANVVNSVNPIQIYMLIASCIWIAGMVVILIYSIVSVVRLRKRLKDAQLMEDNIYETSNIKTPFVFGIVRPKIYLPVGLDHHELTYIILHEYTHIRRKDHVIKIVAFIVLLIHWFNPLAWIAFVLMSTDMELSCDEHVLKEMNEDVKKPYANSLLSLAMGGHIINGSPLAFGEGNVKGRIKNVLNYKKPSFWMMVVSIIAVTIISIALVTNPRQENANQKDEINIENSISNGDNVSEDLNNRDDKISENLNHQVINVSENSNQQEEYDVEKLSIESDKVYQTEHNKVRIEFASDMMSFKAANKFETTNYRIVAYIDTILNGGDRVSIMEDDLKNNYTNQYVIKLSNESSESSCKLYYDTLYDKAYFQKYNGLYEIDVDFARYIDSFLENTDIEVDIDDTDAVVLFEMYGWTLDYKINSMEQKINNIKTLGVFNPNAYYFAFNNELSKDIGLDMSGYSDTADIKVDIYRVNESMPQEFYPIQNCRGIVVKNENKIIGAFISAGRHSTFNACSLKGTSFEEVTGQNFNVWLTDMVQADEFEDKISKLEPEQVIEEYFLALDKKDANAAKYYISRETLLGNLTSNMRNEEIFNEQVCLPLSGDEIGARSSLSNLKSARLIKVEPIYGTNSSSITFSVTMNMKYKKEGIFSSGEQFWNCIMIYESPQTGWKIVEFGH